MKNKKKIDYSWLLVIFAALYLGISTARAAMIEPVLWVISGLFIALSIGALYQIVKE